MKLLRLAPLFTLLTVMAATAQKRVEHVILIGSDGFGAYAFDSTKVPFLRQMMEQGAWSLKARTVLPSSSAPSWASLPHRCGSAGR